MTQAQEIGITRIMAGIISAVGNWRSFIIRKPVAIMRKPPQALKSPIMAFVVRGRMKPALTKRRKKTINCGMAIMETM